MSVSGSSAPSPCGRVARRLTGGAILAGGLIGTTLFGALPSAFANEDPALNPPNCSAADLEGVRSGVSAATSAYLFTHPDYNYFVTSLEGLSKDQVAKQMKDYLNAHPDTKDDITASGSPCSTSRTAAAERPKPALGS